MHFLLFFTILAVILSGSVGVQPGDPFPTDQSEPNTSEEIINVNEIGDSSHKENPMNNIILTSTKSTLIIKTHPKTTKGQVNPDKKVSTTTTKSTFPPQPNEDKINKNHNIDEKPSLSTTSFSKKNLIKIGRWKYECPVTKKMRYWYEPEGGHMGAAWTFDTFVWQAYSKSEPDTEPVYAFHSEVRSIWTNTVQMDPKAPIIGNDQWISDGVSFYTYKTSMNSTELQPVFRYWNKLKADATDATATRITYLTMKKDDNNDDDRSEWTFDDIIFYALPVKDY